MIRKLLLSVLFFLLSFFSFGKNTPALNINTIRANEFSNKISIVASTITSTSTGGNWNSTSSWVGGVVPSATDDVVIASGATITSTGTINAKTLTIDGTFIVSGTVTLNSITQLTINGLLTFADNNSNIHLPSGTAVKVNSPGKVDNSVGCSNNVAIYIGTIKIAACTGNGGGTVYSFSEFNSGGGTMNAIANSNSPVCQNGTINLTGSYSGSAGTKTSGGAAGVNYSWSMKAPDGTITTSNSQNYSLTASQTGSYTAILTCTTYYGNDLYTSTSTITVAVSQAFSLTSVTAVKCTSSSTPIITLNSTASGLPTGTYTVTYNTTNPSATAKTATMTVSTAGSGSFTSTDLTTVNSSTITITNLASGSSGNSCSNAISSGNTATLQTPPSPQSGYLAYVAPACFNSPITINLTGTIVGAVVRWEKRLSPSTTWTTIANTTNSYTETPATAGTWEYRVMVGDVNCGTVYTGVLQVEIRPQVTVTLNSTNSPVCKNGVSSTLTYSATTGSPNGYELLFDSAAKSAGFGDQGGSFTAGSGTIAINVPYGVAVGTYNATVRVFIYSTSCTSVTYPVTVTVSAQIASVSIAPTATQNFCTSGNVLTVTESGGTITSRQWGKRSVSGGTITPISGATGNTYLPTSSDLTTGTWYLVCTSSNGGCIVTSNEVIVNIGNIVGNASSTPTLCVGTPLSPAITHTTINATGINSAGITGLPSGVTASWNANTITISGTPSATGTFNYSIPLTGCGNAVNATGTITVTTLSTAPTGATGNTTICNGASTTLTVTGGSLGTGATTQWYTGSCGGTLAGTGNSITVSPTTNTTYYVRYSGSCNTTSCATVVVTVTPTNTATSSSNPSVCVGVPMTSITHTTTGATGIGTPTNLPPGLTASWLSNTITIGGTPNTPGNYSYSIPLNGGCGSVSATGTITVNANQTVSNASSSPSICINSTMPSVTHTTTGATGISNNAVSGANGLPAGVSASWSSNTITISGIPTTSGTFDYSIPLTGGCGSANATGRITVNPANTVALTSATGTDAQSICKGSAITAIRYATTGATGADVTGLPAGVTGTWASNVLTITGTPTTTTGGTFNYTVTLLNGCGNVTTTGTITVAVPNRGQVHGGKHICLGDDSPQLYMGTFSGTIIKWQYSDDPAESSGSWIDIPNTANLTTYQPAKLTALRTFRTVVQNGTCPAETAVQTRIDIDIRPTFTVSPSAISCPNTDVTYTTQSGQGNYRWTVPGTLGTDYTITSGGVSTSSSTVTLKWLTAGSKTVTVTYSNACSNNPVASSTTTINTYSVSSGPVNLSVCINTPINSFSHTLQGYDGIGTGSFNLPSGLNVNYDSTNKLITISGTPTSTGSFDYSIPLTVTGCSISGEAKGTIVVNALPATPSASVTTQPTCSGTKGTITITATAGYTYSIDGTNYYNQTVFSSLDPGNYTVTAKNASGCISSSGTLLQVNTPASKTWTGTTSADWNVASNWNPAAIPTSSDCVIIPAGVINNPVISGTNGNFYAYTLTVNDQGNLTVKSGNTLRVTSSVNVLSSATTAGTLFFESTSSLIQTDTNPNINTGKIKYQRTSLPIRLADYIYWSSPVQGQTLAGVSPQTSGDKYFSYDGSKWVGTDKTSVMTVGKGYIIRGPQTYSNTTRTAYTATFSGVPNNGNLTGETVAANKFYLVGNPYPSALDADTFISDNFSILEGTLYFWTHNTPVVLGGAYQYSTDDYASYNLSGSVKTSKEAASGTNATGNNNEKPSGKIGAGQSFFAGTKAAGTIVFNNDMRGGAADNTQFFKPGKNSKTGALEKNRVWLNMENSTGAFKQLLVGYIEGASNSYESGFDGVSFDGNKYLDFYSINDGSNLVIQGRALPFTDTDTVPLGYRTTIADDFTISIDETDGSMTTQKIYLEDKTTGTIHDLTQSNYTFTTTAGTFANRFVLRYTNKSLGTGDFENIENGVLISVKDKIVKVISSKENLKEVNVYDISGKLLYTKTKVSSNELQLSNLQSSNQVLIVKVTLENDFTVSKKVIFN